MPQQSFPALDPKGNKAPNPTTPKRDAKAPPPLNRIQKLPECMFPRMRGAIWNFHAAIQ